MISLGRRLALAALGVSSMAACSAGSNDVARMTTTPSAQSEPRPTSGGLDADRVLAAIDDGGALTAESDVEMSSAYVSEGVVTVEIVRRDGAVPTSADVNLIQRRARAMYANLVVVVPGQVNSGR